MLFCRGFELGAGYFIIMWHLFSAKNMFSVRWARVFWKFLLRSRCPFSDECRFLTLRSLTSHLTHLFTGAVVLGIGDVRRLSTVIPRLGVRGRLLA